MIQKILSTGHPGVGQGAIRAALSLELPHIGEPSFEDDAPFQPQATTPRKEAKCIEAHVRNSDGTLILMFSEEEPEDVAIARKSAGRYNRPWLMLHLEKSSPFHASQEIHEWLKTHDVQILHIVGSSGPAGKKEEKTTQGLLEAVYYLGLIEHNTMASSLETLPDHNLPPTSVEDFVSTLLAAMPLKDRVLLAHMREEKLGSLQTTLGRHIEMRVETWRSRSPLPTFFDDLKKQAPALDDIPLFLIKALWTKVRQSHRLRLVK